jgi:hypothetical protein
MQFSEKRKQENHLALKKEFALNSYYQKNLSIFKASLLPKIATKNLKKNIVTGLSNNGNEFIIFEQFYPFFSGYFFKSKRKLFKTGLDE